jgi:hypothetical protein
MYLYGGFFYNVILRLEGRTEQEVGFDRLRGKARTYSERGLLRGKRRFIEFK